jgi:hypothetical protein
MAIDYAGDVGYGIAAYGEGPYGSSSPTLVGDINVSLTGQATSVALGSLGPQTTKTATGQSLTVARGTVAVADRSLTLAGQQAALALTTPMPTFIRDLGGLSLSTSQDSISPTATTSLMGEQTSVDQGNFPDPNDVFAALTGSSSALAQGAVTTDVAIELVGLGISSDLGTFTLGSTTGLSGQELASVVSIMQGITMALDAPLVDGQVLSTGLGTLVPTRSSSVAGSTMTVAAGRAVATLAMRLSGQQLPVSRGSIAFASFSTAPSGNKAVVPAGLNRAVVDATLNRVAVDPSLNEADVP